MSGQILSVKDLILWLIVLVSDRMMPFRFASFELDAGNGELRRDGRLVKLPPQSVKVLCLLVTHADQVVEREQIRLCLWPRETDVDCELGINYCLGRIRSALHDHVRKPRFIETIPRRGYRFIARLERNCAPLRPLLAVLPFVNLNRGADHDWIADGLTDELITKLAERSRVISRQSVLHFKGTTQSLPDIGRELCVDAIVEGCVLPEGGRIRISAQLVRFDPEEVVWARSFDFASGDVLTLLRLVVSFIVEGVCHTLKEFASPRPDSVTTASSSTSQ